MLAVTVWGVTMVALVAVTLAAFRLVETGWSADRARSAGRQALIVGGAVLGEALLALALNVRFLADLDARVVVALTGLRGEVVGKVFTVVTTMGDVIPSFTIAGILAVVVYRLGAPAWGALLLPVVVVVAVLCQFVISDLYGGYAMADLAPEVMEGGPGLLPSGSVARLSALFLTAACLVPAARGRAARALVSVGAVLVVVQAVTRLALGRHLVADILGGLLVGVALATTVALVAGRRPSSDAQDVRG